MASLKLISLFAIILILTKVRVKIGFAIALGAVIGGFMFGMESISLLHSIWDGVKAAETWELLIILISVSFLGSLLKESGRALSLTDAVESLLRSKRASMVILPALIGLLPMPGGALLSAPLIDEVGNRTDIEPTRLAAINYWFRHMLEYVWPLYLGIILASSILEIKVGKIISAQWPMSVGMLIGGILFLLVPLGKLAYKNGDRGVLLNIKTLILNFWPILSAVVLSLVFGVVLYISISISLILFILVSRFPKSVVLTGVKEATTVEYISFVFAVMIFKQVLIDSCAADLVAVEIISAGINPIWVVIFIPFMIGLISGSTPAFVSLAYPALLPFIKPDEVNILLMATAYCAGFLGVLLSPLHFCLVLTAEYFKAPLGRVYIYLIGPLAFMVLGLLLKFIVP